MYDTDTISAMASGLGEALADGVEPIYSESYGQPVTLELTCTKMVGALSGPAFRNTADVSILKTWSRSA